jgi:hypothetical protein
VQEGCGREVIIKWQNFGGVEAGVEGYSLLLVEIMISVSPELQDNLFY